MSREIEFRGKQLYGGNGWCFGFYSEVSALNLPYITKRGETKGHEIIPETVGQFSGFFAANDEKIYTGDVIARFVRDEKNAEPRRLGVFEVVYCKGGFRLKDKHAYEMGWDGCHIEDSFRQLDELKREVPSKELFVKKLGNIHDNPELLKEFESEYRRFWEELKKQAGGK